MAFKVLPMSLLREIVIFLSGCVLLSTKLTSAQVLLPGPCPIVNVMTGFVAPNYLGKWYEAEKYFFIFELGGKCITADYSDLGDGRIGVTNRQINIIKGTVSEINGEAKLVSDTEAKLEVRFPSVPGNFGAPYWILDTDYDSYAVVWSCNNFGIFHLISSWILTREQNPPTSVLEKAYAVADRNNVNRFLYLKTDQTNCS